MDFDTWSRTVNSPFRGDPIWNAVAFRLAMYLLDQAWEDIQLPPRYRFLNPVCSQLYRAIGSIGSNFAEGYGRSSGRDRARLFEYSLGSNRESQVWYYACRRALNPGCFDARFETMRRITQLLVVSIRRDRRRNIKPQDDFET